MLVDQSYEVIIVGGGPAGLTAGLYCNRAALKTLLLEKGLIGGQIAISKEVENYPGMRDITGFDLAEKLVEHARAFGLTIMQHEIDGIRPGADYHRVLLAGGEELRTTALIIALGGTARKLGVPGEAEYLGIGVSYCPTCDGFFFRDKVVIVVGGGDTAVEEAVYLARLVRKVYVLHRRSEFRASKLLQDRLFAEPKIEVLWNSVVTEIKGDGKTVSAVAVEHTQTGARSELETDGVFILIGYSPNSKVVPPAIRVNELGFIVTDQKCATNIPGIFAAGDVREKFANQIVVAAADGCIAALAAAQYIERRQAGLTAQTPQ